jgi:hypothetical protein
VLKTVYIIDVLISTIEFLFDSKVRCSLAKMICRPIDKGDVEISDKTVKWRRGAWVILDYVFKDGIYRMYDFLLLFEFNLCYIIYRDGRFTKGSSFISRFMFFISLSPCCIFQMGLGLSKQQRIIHLKTAVGRV